MGIKTTGLTRPIVVWDLKSLKGTQFGEKCKKLQFYSFYTLKSVCRQCLWTFRSGRTEKIFSQNQQYFKVVGILMIGKIYW